MFVVFCCFFFDWLRGGTMCIFAIWLKCTFFIWNHKKKHKREEERKREREREGERDWEGERESSLCFVLFFGLLRGGTMCIFAMWLKCAIFTGNHTKKQRREEERQRGTGRGRERALYVFCLFLFGLVGGVLCAFCAAVWNVQISLGIYTKNIEERKVKMYIFHLKS